MSQATQNNSSMERGSVDGAEQLETAFQSAQSTATECVSEKPITSAMVSLAAGIGAGLLIGSILSGSNRSRERVANQIGRQMLETMSSAVPDYFK